MVNSVTARTLSWTESGLVPDPVMRAGIRRLLDRKLIDIHASDVEKSAILKDSFVESMRQAPVAPAPRLANEQHYEIPAEFFAEVLGRHRKYSCCYWREGVADLDAAEAAALDISIRRAGVTDGMRVLDLGCGWGALSLELAERFPAADITAVSNSRSQRDFITAAAKERGFGNIDVVVCDMNDFEADGSFDRIVSVEMFEHMRNYGELFRRISGWLTDDGRMFLHIFCHRTTPYEYVDRGPSDWMSRHFFSGGMMPSSDLPMRFSDDLVVGQHWQWNGLHYAKTLRAWLERLDARRDAVMPILEAAYGRVEASRWLMRWRMFFIACEELFAYKGGGEWFVSHYLMRKAAG